MDNVLSELLKTGGEALDSDISEDLEDKGMAERVDTVARHTFTKERQV